MKRPILLAAVLLLTTLSLSAADKRAFGIEDLYRVKSVSGLSATRDGRSIVYAVSETDLPRAKRSTHLWMADASGANARQITYSDKSESSPVLSPDGTTIAFVSSREGGESNLYLLPLAGGEARKLTSIATGVSDPVWSPDGKSIAFASDVYPECGADDACNRKIADTWSNGPLKAHTADSLLYRHWTEWKDGKRTHILLADAKTGETRDLTPGNFDAPHFSLGGPVSYDFSPDGTEFVYASNHDAHPESSTNNDLFVISLKDPKAAKNITASNPAFDSSPRYSPDGRYIAYRMQKQPGYESDLFRIALYDRQKGTSTVLTESFRNWIDDFKWSDDSKTIYFTAEVEGVNPIYRLDVASGQIAEILRDRTIDEFEVAKDGSAILYSKRSVGSPVEIYRAALGATPAITQLSHLNEAFVNEVDVRPAETMWVEGAGGAKVQVFIVKPHNFDPSKKYPLILNVHGGPQSQWADSFRGDWQVYPGAGYVVAFPNPHGSTGFGQDYTAQISGDWGGMVFEDVMKVTDALEKLPYVDKDRIGAMGWSYGGYMMMWLEGHTTRYKAIASMMGVYDLRAMFGATEELWFPEWDLKGQPWNSELYAKWSPSNYVTNFKTPCLVISGERDYRVPYTQSLEFFTDLQKMNVPSKLFIYSDAGHWPSWYEMALYYTAHLEWFHKYLGGGDAPWTTEAFLRNAVFDKATGKRLSTETPAGEKVSTTKAEQKSETPKSSGKKDAKPKG